MDPVARTAFNLALERLLNRVLALDPISTPRLQPWEGSVLTLCLQPPGAGFSLLIHSDHIQVISEGEGPSDARITGTPLGILRFLTPASGDAATAADCRIEGNQALVEDFRNLLQDLEPDWEAELAAHLGDVVAHEAGRRIRQGLSWGRQAGQTLLANLEEFLAEESRLLPARAEVEHRFQDAAPLEQALDDLDLRIQRLEKLLRKPRDPS